MDNWLDSAVSITQDILTMAKGVDDSNKSAAPTPAPVVMPKLATPGVVPPGMVATPANSNSMILAVVAVVVLLLLWR